MMGNLSQSGNNQSGNMSIEKDPKKVLKSSLKVLQKSYSVAKKKDDIENMLAISDRLMLLYELLKNNETKKTAMGFLREIDDE
jgi:hypothetical protein